MLGKLNDYNYYNIIILIHIGVPILKADGENTQVSFAYSVFAITTYTSIMILACV